MDRAERERERRTESEGGRASGGSVENSTDSPRKTGSGAKHLIQVKAEMQQCLNSNLTKTLRILVIDALFIFIKAIQVFIT